LWGGAADFETVLLSYNPNVYWPLDDASTWTTTADTIDEDLGGSDATKNNLASAATWTEGTSIVSGLSNSAVVPASCAAAQLWLDDSYGHETATHKSATWLGWMQANAIPGAAFIYGYSGVGSSDPTVAFDYRPGPGWLVSHGGHTADLSTFGFTDSDATKITMYACTIERLGVNSFRKKAYVCQGGSVTEVMDATSAGDWDGGECSVACNYGQPYKHNAVAVFPTNLSEADITAIYNAGK
jgi:hypothetical protein